MTTTETDLARAVREEQEAHDADPESDFAGEDDSTDREGDLDVVVGTKGIKVHTLRKPAGADWIQDA